MYDFQSNADVSCTVANLIEKVSQTFLAGDSAEIQHALDFAIRAHGVKKRDDGSPYVIHPVRVALLLLQYDNIVDRDVILVALLHDVLEESTITDQQLQMEFGTGICNQVKMLTRHKPDNETPDQRRQSKTAKWNMIMQSDRNVRLVKTFDYLDNMICWKFIPRDAPGFRKIPRWLMAAESLYIPLARITSESALRLMEQELDYYLRNGYVIGDWYSD